MARVINIKRTTLDPADPYASATQFLEDRYTIGRVRTLRHHNGSFYHYAPTTSYREAEVATLRSDLWGYLAAALKVGGRAGECFKPTAAKVSDVVDAVRGLSHLPVSSPAPCWLEPGHPEDPADLLACANGIIHLPTRKLLPSTPHLFTVNGIGFAYDVAAPKPTRWLAFLEQLMPSDPEAQALLQEWMGYQLTTRTHYQKILMIIGPKRSGKGTIGRVLRELVGRHHLVAPTLSTLGEQFGRSVLIDKTVALIADARLSGRSDMAVLAEVLLSISGEDPQSVPRKNLTDWTGTLCTRFTIMTNEIPRLPDASGALASRFLLLLLRESFYGREDQALFQRLVVEMPGILNWALDGLARVTARGRFTQPASAADAVMELENLASPVMAFVREQCVIGAALSASKDAVYQAYRVWCQKQGQSHIETQSTFGRNLRAALPFIGDGRVGAGSDRDTIYRGLALSDDMTEGNSEAF